MQLSDKVYKILKWGLLIFIPALLSLIISLGKIYGFDTETITLTISAISTFLGVITGISTYNYILSQLCRDPAVGVRNAEEA